MVTLTSARLAPAITAVCIAQKLLHGRLLPHVNLIRAGTIAAFEWQSAGQCTNLGTGLQQIRLAHLVTQTRIDFPTCKQDSKFCQ